MKDITPPPGGKLSTRSSTIKATAADDKAAPDDKVIDRYLSALNRHIQGDAYVPDRATLFAEIVERWRRFVARVMFVDAALRAPLAPGNALALANAFTLGDESREVTYLVSCVGDAIAWHRHLPLCLLDCGSRGAP